MSFTVTILGCGSSSGIPMLNCDCPTCSSDNPKNTRLRASIWLKTDNTSILFDSSPDLRQQALTNGIKHIDAVVYTHDHADHLHGIDELRNFNYALDAPVPIYTDAQTKAGIAERFPYVFLPKPEPFWYRPCLEHHLIDTDSYAPFTIGDVTLRPFEQHHGQHEGREPSKTLGFRVGNFAYSTDVNAMPEASFEALAGVETWIVDCLRYHEAPTHAHLELTLAWIERIKPKRAILFHMAHQLEYDELKSKLPEGVEPAYDGMKITF